MPYSEKQQQVARAVEHGFRPTGSASGFTKKFADLVMSYTKGKRKKGEK